MKTITDIKPQLKAPTRCNIYLDNVFYCGLELETVMKNRLKIGQQIEPSKLDEIQFESELIRATDKALSLLSKSPKTKKQVKDYLVKKGYTEATCEGVIQKLLDYKYLSDGDYASQYARSQSKNKGKKLIGLELKKKGVSAEDIQSAVEEVGDQTDVAVKIAQKYLKNKEKDKANTYKCYKYLLSKGFDYDVAKSAVEKVGNLEDDIL